MNIPNLFIVGQQKSGTTALRDFLCQHPQVYFPEQDEMHHFESDLLLQRLIRRRHLTPYLIKRYNAAPEHYLDHYKPVDNETVIGDKTPTYLSSKTSAAEIYDFNPAAKIIALFREPVSYLFSLHLQNLFNLYENEENFEKALALEESRKKGLHLTRRAKGVAHLLFYSEKIKYSNQLMRYVRLFPREQIKCILFEDFKKDNLAVVKEVLHFLDVDPAFTPRTGTVNPARQRRFKWLKKVITPMAMTGIPAKLIPGPVYRWLKGTFNRASTVYTPGEPLSPELESSLKKKFKPEVIRFNTLLHESGMLDEKKNLMEIWQYETN
jgi:hypothetical protein